LPTLDTNQREHKLPKTTNSVAPVGKKSMKHGFESPYSNAVANQKEYCKLNI